MKSIQAQITKFIHNGGRAVFAKAAGKHGVVFTDENEFFEWSDLGLSKSLGFYRISSFPDEPNECGFEDWTVHPVTTYDNWPGYAILDGDGFGFLVGERWQLEELYWRIARAIGGEFDEPIPENDESLGTTWYTINEAVHAANRFDPDEYPIGEKTAERIRRSAQRGTLAHSRTDSGRYKFRATRFRHWLVENSN